MTEWQRGANHDFPAGPGPKSSSQCGHWATGGPHSSSHPPTSRCDRHRIRWRWTVLTWGQRLLGKSHAMGLAGGTLELAQQGGKPKPAPHRGRGPDTDHLRAQWVQGGLPHHTCLSLPRLPKTQMGQTGRCPLGG